LSQTARPAPDGVYFFHEGPLDDIVAGMADLGRHLETPTVQHRADRIQHAGTAAQHGPVIGPIHGGQADIREQLAGGHQIVYPALVDERLAGHGGIVDQFLPHRFAEEFTAGQFAGDEVAIGQIADTPHPVHQHHSLEAVIGFRILDHAEERRQARARAEQVQMAGGLEIVQYQGAGGFAADQQRIAFLQMLQARSQGTVLHLDAEEFQVILIVGAGDAVGAQQRPPVDFQADHDELAVFKAQARVAGRGETEQRLVPMPHTQDCFSADRRHGEVILLRKWIRSVNFTPSPRYIHLRRSA